MREAQLRNVLLVKAIEETDGTEHLIPESDRKTATREVARNTGDAATATAADPGARLARRAQRMLAARADTLLAPVVARHPFVARLTRATGGSAPAGALLILVSALCGGALSALDGTKHIDIVSLPMLGLILWNLLVYAAVVLGWLTSLRQRRPRRVLLPGLAAAWVLRRVRRFVAASADYNAPLAKALDRFIAEWSGVAKPLLLARATRLFHLCAAAAGVGLICALYLRSLTVDYSAGWESTFLDAGDVHTFVSIFYGPASAITGISIPDAAHLERIRWQNGVGGERAAYWIHLLAASIAIYIVAPRLVLAALATLSIWRRAFDMDLPASLAAYFGATFGAGQASGLHAVTVVPYGYAPTEPALAGLRARLVEALGDGVALHCLPSVPYGEEDAVLRAVPPGREAGALILLLNLAATPEEENHGVAIDRLHRGASSHNALVIVDEGPYAARMLSQGGAAERMTERRRLWEGFVEKHGSSACFMNLDAEDRPQPSDAGAESGRLRAALLHL